MYEFQIKGHHVLVLLIFGVSLVLEDLFFEIHEQLAIVFDIKQLINSFFAWVIASLTDLSVLLFQHCSAAFALTILDIMSAIIVERFLLSEIYNYRGKKLLISGEDSLESFFESFFVRSASR